MGLQDQVRTRTMDRMDKMDKMDTGPADANAYQNPEPAAPDGGPWFKLDAQQWFRREAGGPWLPCAETEVPWWIVHRARGGE